MTMTLLLSTLLLSTGQEAALRSSLPYSHQHHFGRNFPVSLVLVEIKKKNSPLEEEHQHPLRHPELGDVKADHLDCVGGHAGVKQVVVVEIQKEIRNLETIQLSINVMLIETH